MLMYMDLNGGKKVLSRHYMKSELTLIAVKAEGSGHLCEKKKCMNGKA